MLVVMGQLLVDAESSTCGRFGLQTAGVQPLQCFPHALVQPTPLSSSDRVVHHGPDLVVSKIVPMSAACIHAPSVGGRRSAVGLHQPPSQPLVQAFVHRLHVWPSSGLQERDVELAPDDGRQCQQPLRRLPQPPHPLQDHILHTGRQCPFGFAQGKLRRRRASPLPESILSPAQRALLLQIAHRLGQDEGVPLALAIEKCAERLSFPLPNQGAGDLPHRLRGERFQDQAVHQVVTAQALAQPGQRMAEGHLLWPVGAHDPHPRGAQVTDQVV